MRRFISRTLIALFSAFIIVGCTSREDKYFPEFSVKTPIIVSTNDGVLVGEVYQPREICKVSSIDEVKEMYGYMKYNYSGDWENIIFKHYAPRYHVEFGDVKITISHGGITMLVPRSNYLITQDGKTSFYKRVSELETFELIRHLCPDANPAGPHESPIVDVEIRNISGQRISGVSVSGGGQMRPIASVEPMRTGAVSLVPEADSELELSFIGSSADRIKCDFRIALAPGMNGKIEIDITDDMACEIRRDSTSLF